MNMVFVLLLFCVFTAAVLVTLLVGANAYRSISDHMQQQYTERTCLAYIEAKIHHYDKCGRVVLEPFGDEMALALYEDLEGTVYKTLIYHHDGMIKELVFEEGLQHAPAAGQAIIKAQALRLYWAAENLLSMSYTADDGVQTVLAIYLHSGEEVPIYV